SVVLASPFGLSQGNGPFLLTAVPGQSFNGTFDDQAQNPITLAAFPANPGVLTGTFRPQNAISRAGRFIYQGDPNGGRALLFNGNPATAGLTLNSWSITFTVPETSTRTDGAGNYAFSNLLDGTYQVTVANEDGANPVQTVSATSSQVDIGIRPNPDLI